MGVGPSRLLPRLPDPGRGWIAQSPGRWQACDRTWVDLAESRLVAGLASTSRPRLEIPDAIDALVYLPPVALLHREVRDQLASALVASGATTMVQLVPGEDPIDGTLATYDLSGPLIAGDLDRLTLVPADAWVLWPLLPGITDHESLIGEGCERLAAHGVRVVQPLAVDIPPALAQQLASGRSARVFDALFRGRPPAERPFAAIAAAHGLSVWPPRPDTGATPRIRNNRRLATTLALAAELWLRLDRPQAAGQALYRAARGVETSDLDLVAVIREGNVRVLDYVDARAADLLEEIADGDDSKLLRELRAAYVGAS